MDFSSMTPEEIDKNLESIMTILENIVQYDDDTIEENKKILEVTKETEKITLNYLKQMGEKWGEIYPTIKNPIFKMLVDGQLKKNYQFMLNAEKQLAETEKQLKEWEN